MSKKKPNTNKGWYYKNGKIKSETVYDNGAVISETLRWDYDGNIIIK